MRNGILLLLLVPCSSLLAPGAVVGRASRLLPSQRPKVMSQWGFYVGKRQDP